MDRIFLVKDNKAFYVCGGGEVREWEYGPKSFDSMAYPITQHDITHTMVAINSEPEEVDVIVDGKEINLWLTIFKKLQVVIRYVHTLRNNTH